MRRNGSWVPGLLVAALLAGGCGAPGRSLPRRVTVLVTGFMQGQIADWERPRVGPGRRVRIEAGALRMNTFLGERAAAARRRGAAVLQVDLGDFMAGSSYSGSPEAMATRGAASVAVMASRDYHAILLGNREFHFGGDRLEALASTPPGGGGPLPLVSTNVHREVRGGPPTYARRSLRVDLGVVAEGARVLGITPLELEVRAEPEHIAGLGVRRDVGALLREHAPGPGDDGELTVVLSQIDVIGERPMLEEAVRGTGVDLFLGHAYGRGADPYRVGGTWFAGLRNDRPGAAVLELDLTVDPGSGAVLSLDQEWYVLAGGDLDETARARRRREADERGWSVGGIYPGLPRARDAGLAAVLDGLGDDLRDLDRPIGSSRLVLFGDYERESTLGNLVADAFREAAGSDVGLVSASVVDGVTLSEGELLERDLYRMYRYPNDVVAVRVSGGELREALARKLAEGIHHQVSGLRVTWRPEFPGADEGELVSVEVGGRPVDPSATYAVAMDSFAYRRNPVFSVQEPRRVAAARDALRDHVRARSPVRPELERRIVPLDP